MGYIKFKGRSAENNLIRAILSSSQASALTQNFPKISAIAGSRIVPDIDILCVEHDNGSKKLIGYELKINKLIRRNDDSIIGFEWQRVYVGIAEALLCLQYGLDQCGLIFGFHENCRDRDIEWFCRWLESRQGFLSRILGPYFTLGIFQYERGGIYEVVKATSNFWPTSEMMKFKSYRENLLLGSLSWDKRLAQQCVYAEKQPLSAQNRFSGKTNSR